MRLATALIADAATVAEGKLFVHGGGWTSLSAAGLPVVHPSMALALVFRVDFGEALTTGEFRVELVDEDGSPQGPAAGGQLTAGHAPGTRPGQDIDIPLALTFPAVRFERAGRYRWAISWNGEPVDSVAFSVEVRAVPGGTP